MSGEKEVSFTIRAKDAASAVLKEVEKAAHHTVQELFSFKEAIHLIAGAIGAFSLVEVIRDMVNLGVSAEKTFRQISAALPTATEGIHELKEGIDELGRTSGRALDELETAALGIAKLGVSSSEELGQVLHAATMLANGANTSVMEAGELLIQLRREFHITGEEALATAAKLASVSQGKIAITELLAAYQASAPQFIKFGIDLETGTKAIAALVGNGFTTTRQIRGAINGLDASGIRELASQATIASTAMADLEKRAKLVSESVSATNQKLKNEFEITLKELSTDLLPHVNGALEAMHGMLVLISSMKLDNIIALFSGNPGQIAAAILAGKGGEGGGHGRSPLDSDPSLDRALGLGKKPESTGTKPFKMPISEADKKALEEAAKKLRELRVEFAQLVASTDEAKAKSEQFADAIAKYPEKAKAAGASTQQITNDLIALNQTLDQMRAAEKDKAISGAFEDLDTAMTALSAGPVATLDREIASVFKKLQDVRNGKDGKTGLVDSGDEEALKRFDDRTVLLATHYEELRKATVDAADATDGLAHAEKYLEDAPGNISRVIAMLDIWGARAVDVRAKMDAATDPTVQKAYKDELAQIEKLLKQIGQEIFYLPPKTEDASKQVRELADAWATAGRSIIAAAQAMGAMDTKTAATLQNVISLGDGIARLFSAKTKGEKAAAVLEGAPAALALSSQIGAATGSTAGAVLGGGAAGAASGALIGTMILPGLGTAIGAIVGSLGGMVAGFFGHASALKKAREELAKGEDAFVSRLKTYASSYAQSFAEIQNAFKDLEDAARATKTHVTQDVIDAKTEAERKIREDFWDGIRRGINSLSGPTGEYLNALEDINKEYVANIITANTLGATMEQQAQITALYEAKLAALNANSQLQRFSDANQAGYKATLDALNASVAEQQRIREIQQQQLDTDQEALAVNEKQLSAQQQSVGRLQQLVDRIRTFAAGLLLNTGLTPLGPEAQLAEAKRQYQAQLALARAGDQDATENITAFAQAVLEASHAVNASGQAPGQPGYLSDFAGIQADLASLDAQYSAQLTTEQQILSVLQSSNDKLSTQIGVLAAILKSQTDYYVVGASAGPHADPNFYNWWLTSGGGSGSTNSPGGSYWDGSAAGFASGGSFGGGMRLVGEMGPELEFTGPSRIFSASDTKKMFASLAGSNGGAQSELLGAVRDLTTVTAAGFSAQVAVTRENSDRLSQVETELRYKRAASGPGSAA